MIGTVRLRCEPRISSARVKPSISGMCIEQRQRHLVLQQQLQRLRARTGQQQVHALALQ